MLCTHLSCFCKTHFRLLLPLLLRFIWAHCLCFLFPFELLGRFSSFLLKGSGVCASPGIHSLHLERFGPHMEAILRLLLLSAIIAALSARHCVAQTPEAYASSARALDALLQDYAYRAFVHPRTGIIYDGQVPSNLTGIKIAALRLRSGSLRRRGFKSYKEFDIPVGVIIEPYVERVALIYHNLGNWSSYYYPIMGYTYLAPVLGLLPYDAANLSATNLPELDLVASGSPISIQFANVSSTPSGLVPKCVWFDLDGVPRLQDLASANVCSTYRRGHFSIVVNNSGIPPPPAPSPPPPLGHKTSSNVWKIVVAAIGGSAALVLMVLLLAWMVRYRQGRRMAEMERRAETGEALQTARVGDSRAPMAFGTRTQPSLETDYVP